MALKTSPSGGAAHPIEAYVAIRRTAALKSGLYHFDSAGHHLVLLTAGLDRANMKRYMPSQPWFWNAPVVVFMVATFARTSWRYPAPRAYRNILLEAGHLAQTFCLLATELGLAPFCTHALVDSAVDRDLGVDGIGEGVVYCVGCGSIPAGGWTAEIPGLSGEPS